MKLLSRLLPSAVLLLAAWCSACGQELVGGWEGGPSNGYSFVSPVFSIPGSGPHSFVVRPAASFLYYNYRDSGGMTDVTSPGVGVLLGYRLRTRRLTLTAGPELRRAGTIAVSLTAPRSTSLNWVPPLKQKHFSRQIP